jgi:hypothetical protein
MSQTMRAGRTIGILLFLQLAGLSLPFILLMPATRTDFLQTAAANATSFKVAVFLLFANGAVTIAIGSKAFPIIRRHSYSLALWLFGMSLVWFVMQSVDNAFLMSMLTMSQRSAEGAAASPELLTAIAGALRGTRRWIHYTELLVINIWFFVLYGAMFRLSLVPRVLSGFGVLMVLVHSFSIPIATFAGYGTMPQLGFSLALSHLAIATWLVVKGFGEHDRIPTPLGLGGGSDLHL